MSSQEREAPGCSQRENRCCARLFPSNCATISSLALCTLIVSSLYLFVSFYMAKSKKKSSVLRFAQQDYGFRMLRPSSSQAQRTLSRSSSPGMQHSSSPPRRFLRKPQTFLPGPPREFYPSVPLISSLFWLYYFDILLFTGNWFGCAQRPVEVQFNWIHCW